MRRVLGVIAGWTVEGGRGICEWMKCGRLRMGARKPAMLWGGGDKD